MRILKIQRIVMSDDDEWRERRERERANDDKGKREVGTEPFVHCRVCSSCHGSLIGIVRLFVWLLFCRLVVCLAVWLVGFSWIWIWIWIWLIDCLLMLIP
jgi:hypothetical protein